MNHDMSRTAIEYGPHYGIRGGSWEDDEPGDPCSACNGDGFGEDWRGIEHDCPICDGSGVAA